jgi:hypothetical protein
VVVYVYVFVLSSFFLLFPLAFYPMDGRTLFSGLLVSIALWKSRSDVGGAELFPFFVSFLFYFPLLFVILVM